MTRKNKDKPNTERSKNPRSAPPEETTSERSPREPRIQDRLSGVLCHVTSLPSPYFIGDLGHEARRFVDFLAASGQSWWQMLPVNPVGMGYSPYSTICSMAAEPLLVSLDELVHDGLLTADEVKAPKNGDDCRANYAKARKFRLPLWHKAFARFVHDESRWADELSAFRQKNAAWLDDFTLFTVLAEHFETTDWSAWPAELAARESGAMAAARAEHADKIRFAEFLQLMFDRQWRSLKAYAAARGIALIGDIPIFVSYESADVWAHQSIFFLDAARRPSFVAGVPPDYFNPDGQRWGNALYRWDVMVKDGFSWWLERFAAMFERFDLIRLDHFIGFHRYWKIPADAPSAREGTWVTVPGDKLFEAVKKRFGKIPFIAEDLGSVTPEVWALRDQFGLPGMRVLQFGFMREEGASYHLPHTFPRNAVAYPGTHDNDTVQGWYDEARHEAGKKKANFDFAAIEAYLGTARRDAHWAMIRAAMTSVANLSVVALQDVLGLASKHRMNTPGTAKGNWTWRYHPKDLRKSVARRLSDLTHASGRLPQNAE